MQRSYLKSTFSFQPILCCAAALCMVLLRCDCPTKPLLPPYIPPVIFTGFIAGDRVTLQGNYSFPNKCVLKNDTVIMNFWSDTFNIQDRIWNGDHLWIKIYRCINDSTLVNGRIALHLARYIDGIQGTFQVTFADTQSPRLYPIECKPRATELFSGGRIQIEEFSALPSSLQQSPWVSLSIDSGKIWGSIQ